MANDEAQDRSPLVGGSGAQPFQSLRNADGRSRINYDVGIASPVWVEALVLYGVGRYHRHIKTGTNEA